MGLFKIPGEYANYEWFNIQDKIEPAVDKPAPDHTTKSASRPATGGKPRPKRRKPQDR